MAKNNKSSNSNPKQTCIDCHFFVYAMEYYNNSIPDQYSFKVVDKYYRNYIKEKCYNYDQSTEIPEECDYSRGYNNEKAPVKRIAGLKCFQEVWPSEEFIELDALRIPRTSDIKTCRFLLFVPMYREKAFEEITEVERENRCNFYKYTPGMSLKAAVKLEKREHEKKMALSQSVQNKEETSKEENIFRYKGGCWEIAFDGKTIFPTDRNGFRYISCILSNHKKELHNFRLYQLANGQITGSVTEGQSLDAKLYTESTTKIQTTKEDKANDYQKDEEMIEGLDKEDEELNIEKSELEKAGSVDKSRLAEIEEQLNNNIETRKLMVKDFNSGGEKKSEKEKITHNVYMNIYRCLKIIEKEHTSLHTHLKGFFNNSKDYTSYRPDRDVLWQTDNS